MITIFGDFRRKKLAFFLKTNLMVRIVQKLVVFCAKKIATLNIFKIKASVPDLKLYFVTWQYSRKDTEPMLSRNVIAGDLLFSRGAA
jgi:hypothetical protein